MMETFVAIVVTVIVVPLVFLGIFLVPVLIGFFLSFVSTWAATRIQVTDHPERVMSAHQA
jgi:hypothetical protein